MPLPALAGPYADLDARGAKMDDARFVRALRAMGEEEAEGYLGSAKKARAYVGLRAALEGAPSGPVPKIAVSKDDDRVVSSWLARTLAKIHLPKAKEREARGGPDLGFLGPWMTVFMWGLLAALGLLAVYLLFLYVKIPGLKRRAKGMVDPDEPLRSADAWLAEADARIARGEYREAVRGLYVAGLMRLDEAGVARFDRHQTNWEHLRRIEASPKAPPGLDVREPTGRFDRVWYGLLPATEADALAMRAAYDALVRALSPQGARA